MKKHGKHLIMGCAAFLFALLFALPAAAALQEASPRAASTATELIEAYEAGGEIALGGRVVLDQELTLGGTQSVTIRLEQRGCLVVRAAVTIDNPNLVICGGTGGVVFYIQENGVLTLKQGTAEIESGMVVLRNGGALQTGAETNFRMALTGPWCAGIGDSLDDPLTLEGLTITGDGERNSGVDRKGTLVLRRCSMTLSGEDSLCVRNATLEEMTDTTLMPPVEISTPNPPTEPAKGTVETIHHKQGVCVAVGAVPELPKTMRAGCKAAGEDTVLAQELPVAWELSSIGEEPGVYEIKGSFTQEGLDAANLANPQNLTLTLKVLRYAENSGVPELWIARTSSRLQVFMYRPFGASAVWLEYSRDGITWERKAENYLISDEELEHISQFDLDAYPLGMPDPYPELTGYDARVIVEGGIFNGVSQSYRVGEDAPLPTLPTPTPGWSEGDRGGGGREEPTRQEPPASVQTTPKPAPRPVETPDAAAVSSAPVESEGSNSSAVPEALEQPPEPTGETEPAIAPIEATPDAWSAMALGLGGTAVVCTTVAAVSSKVRRCAISEALKKWFGK